MAGLALVPVLAALYVGGTQIPGGALWPWNPGMIDLEVYRRTGTLVLSGGDFFNAEGLPWIYPPFAALFTVPFAWCRSAWQPWPGWCCPRRPWPPSSTGSG